jgi:hypothetical protein
MAWGSVLGKLVVLRWEVRVVGKIMNVGTAFYAVFLISIFAMGSSVVMAQQEFKFIDRNQYNYTLVLDHLI